MLASLPPFCHREMQRRERARQLELASAGQKNLRARVQDKRGRAKEQLLGAKKHEAAMKEMARRKVSVDLLCFDDFITAI